MAGSVLRENLREAVRGEVTYLPERRGDPHPLQTGSAAPPGFVFGVDR